MSNNNSGKECDHDEGIRTSGGLATTLVEGRCNLCGTYVGRFDNSGKVEDIFPTWFKKVQVTFSGELPLSQDERQQVFVIPYALFENAIEAYISSKVNEATQQSKLNTLRQMQVDYIQRNLAGDIVSYEDLIEQELDRIRTLKEAKLDQLSKEKNDV